MLCKGVGWHRTQEPGSWLVTLLLHHTHKDHLALASCSEIFPLKCPLFLVERYQESHMPLPPQPSLLSVDNESQKLTCAKAVCPSHFTEIINNPKEDIGFRALLCTPKTKIHSNVYEKLLNTPRAWSWPWVRRFYRPAKATQMVRQEPDVLQYQMCGIGKLRATFCTC